MEAGGDTKEEEEQDLEEEIQRISRKITQQQQEQKTNNDFHHFRLFSYLSMAILSIAILVGLLLILQHVSEEQSSQTTIANQETLIQNQELLKQILGEMETLLGDAKEHEMREEAMLGNNTNTNIGISSGNSQRLNLLLEHFNVTIPESLKIE